MITLIGAPQWAEWLLILAVFALIFAIVGVFVRKRK